MANEKRLIDANALIKIMRAEDIRCPNVPWSTTAVAKHCENLTVDAMQVVRCKDCKHWRDSWLAPDGKHSHGYCYMEESDDVIVGRWDDDFCSYGERKNNG